MREPYLIPGSRAAAPSSPHSSVCPQDPAAPILQTGPVTADGDRAPVPQFPQPQTAGANRPRAG